MKEKKEMENFERIRNLIQKDKKSATENFRRLDFAARLGKHLTAQARPKFYLFFMKNKLVPILGAVLILIGAGMIVNHFISLRASNETFKPAFAAIKDFFREISWEKRAFQNEERFRIGFVRGAEGFYEFVWSVKRVFYSLNREEIADKDVPFLIYEVLQGIALNETTSPSEKEDRDLSKTVTDSVEDLLKESYFHRLIYEVLKKIQEV